MIRKLTLLNGIFFFFRNRPFRTLPFSKLAVCTSLHKWRRAPVQNADKCRAGTAAEGQIKPSSLTCSLKPVSLFSQLYCKLCYKLVSGLFVSNLTSLVCFCSPHIHEFSQYISLVEIAFPLSFHIVFSNKFVLY